MRNTFSLRSTHTLSLFLHPPTPIFPDTHAQTHTHMHKNTHTQNWLQHSLLFQLHSKPAVKLWWEAMRRGGGTHPSTHTSTHTCTHALILQHKTDSASISCKRRVITLHGITIHISVCVCLCLEGVVFGWVFCFPRDKDQKKCPTLLRVETNVGFSLASPRK